MFNLYIFDMLYCNMLGIATFIFLLIYLQMNRINIQFGDYICPSFPEKMLIDKLVSLYE